MTENTVGTIAGVFAFLSIFLWEFSIFPLVALALGIWGVVNAIKEDTPKAMAIWGIVGGLVFLIVRITQL